MTNIIILVKDRIRLTEQCLRTLYAYTPRKEFTLTVCNDSSNSATNRLLEGYVHQQDQIVHFLRPVGIVGFLRNVGIWTSERVFGRGDYICACDNDLVFLPNWLETMTRAKETPWSEREDSGTYSVLGGYRHPFHGINHVTHGERLRIEETDAVAGYMHFMTWATWDKFGPYDAHAKGVCQSEDHALCQKIIANRGHVGYVDPPCIVNCGITNSEGKPAVGSESFPRVPGIVYE
jgi:glycosyltransferase involved in cell wall biosynthesis